MQRFELYNIDNVNIRFLWLDIFDTTFEIYFSQKRMLTESNEEYGTHPQYIVPHNNEYKLEINGAILSTFESGGYILMSKNCYNNFVIFSKMYYINNF